MRALPRLSVVVWLPLTLALSGQTVVDHDFDRTTSGSTPEDFTFRSFRQPDPGRWTVEDEEGNGFLCHQRDRASGWSMAIADGAAPSDLVITARVRLTDGARVGGLVWRYLNDKHFYSLILNLDTRKIELIRVSGGHTVTLDAEDDLELDPSAWHTLKVAHVGTTVKASLGGVHVFEDEDRRYAWGDERTRVGVIAHGDARVEFDDIHVSPRGGRP